MSSLSPASIPSDQTPAKKSSLSKTRDEMGLLIAAKLEENFDRLKTMYDQTNPICHFFLDDVLDPKLAREIRDQYPSENQMMLRNSLREKKFVSAQMNKHNPVLEEIIYAFQHPKVVDVVERITGLKQLEPDDLLYAGGISLMGQSHFLNPHLDNSHDKDKKKYRVLNLLYYVSPNWELSKGGHLELWPDGPMTKPVTVESKFNRLVVMLTNKHSWHSVSKVKTNELRCCVSNYYFSKNPADKNDYYHVTSFRGRPDEPFKDLLLQVDIKARMFLRKLFPAGVTKVTHYYDKK